ncbi:hypothetical protein GUJ93_ZPchr0001g31818 [Zizania palustris]|uniref:Uncharacterized protein n=1 Tax=Zizania palustris TaxID=103762 RepID=A0A8J5VMP4_ZIZPA|nr:hypothetical protein GUJ93_ZPchr0001g31818 [Zizania palustris]
MRPAHARGSRHPPLLCVPHPAPHTCWACAPTSVVRRCLTRARSNYTTLRTYLYPSARRLHRPAAAVAEPASAQQVHSWVGPARPARRRTARPPAVAPTPPPPPLAPPPPVHSASAALFVFEQRATDD